MALTSDRMLFRFLTSALIPSGLFSRCTDTLASTRSEPSAINHNTAVLIAHGTPKKQQLFI